MIRIAVIGVGHIARHEHLPALKQSPSFDLVAAVSPVPVDLPVPVFESIAALMESGIAVDAVAICTPPDRRYALAREAIEAGWHVLLEKPPTLTRSQAQALRDLARSEGVTIFAAWHSIYASAIPRIRSLLSDIDPVSIAITWKENADKWHPGADWLWRPGALGVFDAGINALSILTATNAEPVVFQEARLDFYADQQAPARAELSLTGGRTACPITASFDWRHDPDSEIWEIRWSLPEGDTLCLAKGGAHLSRGEHVIPLEESREYAGVYRHFAQLIDTGEMSLDLRPLDLVSEALAYGARCRH
ncbi:galactose 1-dehydrogenase [Asaia sp. W19]|uniref:Gfo/Idh/MocA family protein n=1 Tax=unclassified Asaia TaxID=2685023 RepID=UPI000F8DD42A|nr:Gfo/Idh/MocA family oxidoreductase [Asaia sp. W19]RUT26711.1 galactose 1-dehydrogenase [Asaia sp. W19]